MRKTIAASFIAFLAASLIGAAPALATSVRPPKPSPGVSQTPALAAPTPILSALVLENRTPCVFPSANPGRCDRPKVIKLASVQTHCWTAVRAYVVSHVAGTVTVSLTGRSNSHSRHLCVERSRATAVVKVVGPVTAVVDASTGQAVDLTSLVAW